MEATDNYKPFMKDDDVWDYELTVPETVKILRELLLTMDSTYARLPPGAAIIELARRKYAGIRSAILFLEEGP